MAKFAVEPLFVEPADPAARGHLEVVETPLWSAVGGEGGGIAVKFGLVQGVHSLRHLIVEGVPDRSDRRRRDRCHQDGRCRRSRCIAQASPVRVYPAVRAKSVIPSAT